MGGVDGFYGIQAIVWVRYQFVSGIASALTLFCFLFSSLLHAGEGRRVPEPSPRGSLCGSTLHCRQLLGRLLVGNNSDWLPLFMQLGGRVRGGQVWGCGFDSRLELRPSPFCPLLPSLPKRLLFFLYQRPQE